MNPSARLATAALAALLLPLGVHAGPHDARIRDLVETRVKPWLADPLVIESIRAQNGRHRSLTPADIERLDRQWRAETRQGPQTLISSVLENPLSQQLKRIKSAAAGLYTEIFVMDDKGLNVGQSDVTSDYWQGDEAKWKKSFLAGAGSIFIDEIEFDESTQQYQVQVNLAVADPASNRAIGAVTIGVNVELLD